MKIIFVGPSLYGASFDADDIVIRGPAQMGDFERALDEGATAIGLIDGHYQQVGAVWHKEILLALAAGVTVYGAASMGALRAAECEPFGMVPIGDIARRYCSGELFDDADVALTNGPAELGFPPLTEAMVDVEATLLRLVALGHIEASAAGHLIAAARRLFFADRTLAALGAAFGLDTLALYQAHRVSQKTADALALVETLKSLPKTASPAPPRDWQFAATPFWTGRSAPRSSTVTPL